MASLYIKEQQVAGVEGAKVKQAIYCKRKRAHTFEIGEKLYLYPDKSIASRKRLRSTRCDDVYPIFIDSNKSVILGSKVLTDKEKHELALAEGYDSFQALFNYFNNTSGLPMAGQLIRWL